MDLFPNGKAVGLVENVAGISLGGETLVPEIFRHPIGRRFIQVQQSNFCAALGQSLGKHTAQHTAGSRDNGNLAGKISMEW